MTRSHLWWARSWALAAVVLRQVRKAGGAAQEPGDAEALTTLGDKTRTSRTWSATLGRKMFVAYPAVESMGSPLGNVSCSSLDGTFGEARWAARFTELIRRSLADTSRPKNATNGAPTKFEALFGCGNQKSGTTSFAHAAGWLGYAKPSRGDSARRRMQRSARDRNFYQDGRVPATQVRALEGILRWSTLFEDDPWFVLYRLADEVFTRASRRVGYVLTVRDCGALAESSAAFNNPSDGLGGNSDAWNADHCRRHFRRCHVHLLDVYRFLVEKSERSGPLDDVLILETAPGLDLHNFRDLVDFAFFGTNRPIYGGSADPAIARERRAAAAARLPRDLARARLDILDTHQAGMPRSNSRSAASKKRTFCPPALLAREGRNALHGAILRNLEPEFPNHNQCRATPSLPGCSAMRHAITPVPGSELDKAIRRRKEKERAAANEARRPLRSSRVGQRKNSLPYQPHNHAVEE